jgi:hypothetical protein
MTFSTHASGYPPDWNYVGDPSVVVVYAPSDLREYIKLAVPATQETAEVLKQAHKWFRETFAERLCPTEIVVHPFHPQFIDIIWWSTRPAAVGTATRGYAQGVLVGFLVSSGHGVL